MTTGVTEEEALKNEIISLGLKYNLLTRYTSFIAIDSLIRTDGDSLSTVTQPLPLPEGVSDYAVGGGRGFGGGTTTFTEDAANKTVTEDENNSYLDEVNPNPVKSHFTVTLFIHDTDKLSDKKLYLFDNTGRVLKIKEIKTTVTGTYSITFDLNDIGNIKNGMYRIALKIDDEWINSKNIVVLN